MKRLLTTKRLLAAVLSFVMILGMLPVIPLSITAEEGNTQNYVSLPITIRDYAADGMLFECNEIGETGTTQKNIATHSIYGVNTKWEKDGYLGVRVVTPETSNGKSYGPYWHGILCESDGSIVDVFVSHSESYHEPDSKTTRIDNQLTGSRYAFWVWCGDSASGANDEHYNALKWITKENMGEYRISYDSTEKELTIYQVFNHADSDNFGLLGTDTNSFYNNLQDPVASADVFVTKANSIPGTLFVRNGIWSTQPDDIKKYEIELYEGVKQNMYGGMFRAGLVENLLSADKKLQYTEATVDYVADVLKNLLPTEWCNGDGTFNMWHSMGQKLEELGGKDLASCLREQIAKNGNTLGTYEEAKAAYENGELNSYTNIDTFYEAAYFLLHSTFTDNVGYGKTVDLYNEMQLVAKTAEDGHVYYVFNSGYDGVKYDVANGVIYNTQTENATLVKNSSGEDQYIRGNPYYKNRFDPLNPSLIGNEGYGISGDTYRYASGISTSDEYYDSTNYHLSLEGHAKFIYHYEENLYFTFTGDDDVYLFINGHRVLDIGGAHAITKVSVDLNNVAELCGLQEGETYDFDFYYMERHGTAANFSIETNIKIVDPAMRTEKTAYQNGVSVDFGGFVDSLQPVTYELALTNNGDAHIRNLTFTDDDIGAVLTPDSITLPSDTDIANLRVTKYKADGSVDFSLTGLTAEQIRAILADGLGIQEKLVIGGINYTIPAEKWTDSLFDNYVYTTAIADGDNSSTRTLNGMDHHRVRKYQFTLEGIHAYDYGTLDTELADGTLVGSSAGVTIDRTKFIETMQNGLENGNVAVLDLGSNEITIPGLEDGTLRLVSASGSTVEALLNPNASIDADGNIVYRSSKIGADTFYVAVVVNGKAYDPIRVDIYTYGVADSVFVLDYNLPVELNNGEHSFTNNDILDLGATNPYATTASVLSIGNASDDYGAFSVNGQSVQYVMSKFMNGVDTVEITVRVQENGATEFNQYTGVEMVQKITVVPANVMYYEDDFTGADAITYINTVTDDIGNIWAVYETETKGTQQSPDQSLNYGSDPNYTENKTDIYNILSLNRVEMNGLTEVTPEYLESIGIAINLSAYGCEGYLDYDFVEHPGVYALRGDASNDTVHAMSVLNAGNAPIMSFNFYGTGFEIVGRTTIFAYSVLTVVVKNLDNGTVKAIPVITECFNGDLTQVPMVVLKDLEQANYSVTVYTSNVNEVDRMVYVDGVRIYQPVSDETAALYYKADESVAEFHEIKTEILKGNIVYGQVLKGESVEDMDNAALWHFGSTVIENYDADFETDSGNFVLKEIADKDLYLSYGPNNEIYLCNSSIAQDANEAIFSYIAFYVEIDENYEGERSIQVGAHLKSTIDNFGMENTTSVDLIFGGKSEDFVPPVSSDFTEKKNFYSVASGTEQYFNVDTCLTFMNPNGPNKALVIIGTKDLNMNVLTLTNIKLNGYKLSSDNDSASAEIMAVRDVFDIGASPLMNETYRLSKALVNASNEQGGVKS